MDKEELARRKLIVSLSDGKISSEWHPGPPPVVDIWLQSNMPHLDKSQIKIKYPKNRSLNWYFFKSAFGILIVNTYGLVQMYDLNFKLLWEWNTGISRPGISAERREFPVVWEYESSLWMGVNTGTYHNTIVQIEESTGKVKKEIPISLMTAALQISPKQLLINETNHYVLLDMAKAKADFFSKNEKQLCPKTYFIELGGRLVQDSCGFSLYKEDFSDVVWSFYPQQQFTESGSPYMYWGEIENLELTTKFARFDFVEYRTAVNEYK